MITLAADATPREGIPTPLDGCAVASAAEHLNSETAGDRWYAIRPAVDADLQLVLESWTGTWQRSPWAGTVRNDRFEVEHHATVAGLLQRGAKLLCLVNAARPSQVLSWLCYEQRRGEVVAHFGFTKRPYRRRGLLKTLLRSLGCNEQSVIPYTHRTRQLELRGWWTTHLPALARRKDS